MRTLAGKRPRLSLQDWHNVLGHMNPGAIKHLEKRGLIEISDATVASDMKCSTCRESKSEALSYARGGRSPKTVGEVVHTDIEGPFRPDVNGMKYFIVFVEEASRDKRVIALKSRDNAVDAASHYLDQMLREGVSVKCLSGDGAGELGRSGKFLRMLTERGIRWRSSPPRTQQSNGIAERAIRQIMEAARSQLLKSGRGEQFWSFAVMDATYKLAAAPHEFLGGETPHERLTGKPFNYARLRAWGSDCYVHQHAAQRGAGAKFHPYAKRGILVGHDRESPSWLVWLTHEEKLVKSAHVVFENEGRLLELVGEMQHINLGEGSDSTAEAEQTINGDQNMGETMEETKEQSESLKRKTPDTELRRSHWLEQQPRRIYSDMTRGNADSVNFLTSAFSMGSEEAFCMMGIAMGTFPRDLVNPTPSKKH